MRWLAVAAAMLMLQCSRPSSPERTSAAERGVTVPEPPRPTSPPRPPSPAPASRRIPDDREPAAEAPTSTGAAPRRPVRKAPTIPRWKRILESGDPGILSRPSAAAPSSASASETNAAPTRPDEQPASPSIPQAPTEQKPSGRHGADEGPATLCSWMAYGHPQMWCTHGSVDKAQSECAKLASAQTGAEVECDCTQDPAYIGDTCKSTAGGSP